MKVYLCDLKYKMTINERIARGCITEGDLLGLLRHVRAVHCAVVTQITQIALNKCLCLHGVPIRIVVGVPEQSMSARCYLWANECWHSARLM